MKVWDHVKQEILNVEKGKVVPISVEAEFPVYNPKYTERYHVTYTALGLLEGKKGLYLVAKEWRSKNTAPVGSIVYFYYSSGSGKHSYYRYYTWAAVEEGEWEATLPPKGERGDPVKVKFKNLRPLPKPTKEELAKVEAEVLNKGWLPSNYEPVKELYHYWVVLKVHEAPPAEVVEVEEGAEEVVQPRVEVPEVKPRELEVELETAPPAPAAVAPPPPARPELVKVYLLSMKLPSKYLVQKAEVRENEEVRRWEGRSVEVASRLEGIRRAAYASIERVFAHVVEYGVWVAVTEEAVKEAVKVSEWIRQELGKLPIKEIKNVDVGHIYSVKAVPVYLEPENARELLDAAVRHLSEDVEELSRRINEAEKEQKRSVLKRLSTDLSFKKALLETFRKYLSQL